MFDPMAEKMYVLVVVYATGPHTLPLHMVY